MGQRQSKNLLSVSQVIPNTIDPILPEDGLEWKSVMPAFLSYSGKIQSVWDGKSTEYPLLIWGLSKSSQNAIRFCWENNHDYYYIDNPYIRGNSNGSKQYRITKNNLQYVGGIIRRPHDKLKLFPNLNVRDMVTYEDTTNKNVLLCPSSSKIMKLYGVVLEEWIEETKKEIQKHTSRNIVVRLKPEKGPLRSTIYEDFDKAYCVVAWNSVAATEALVYGVPAITLAVNAASALCNTSLDEIENLNRPSVEERLDFLAHLSYCQFSSADIYSGFAYKTVEENYSKR